MDADKLLKLAKVLIITMALVFTTILVTFMILEHDPKTFNTTLDLQNQKMEVSCTFAEKTVYGKEE